MSDILEKIEPKERNENINKTIGMMLFNNSKYNVVGSASLKSQLYPSDYDINNTVKFKHQDEQFIKKKIYQKFKKIFNELDKNPDIFITDLKAGIDDELYQDFDNIKQIKEFYKDKPITNKQKKEINEINNLDDLKEYTRKLSILRWNKKDINRGYQMIRGKKKYFEDSLDDGSVIKIDVAAIIDGEFVDLTNIYEFFNGNKTINEIPKTNILDNLQKDAKHYKKEGLYVKYLKRLFSIAKLKKTHKKITILSQIFNSDLGKIYKVYNDIELILLLFDKIDKSKLTKHKDDIYNFIQSRKALLGKIYQFSLMDSIFDKFNDITPNMSFNNMEKRLVEINDYIKLKMNKEAKKIINKNKALH